MENDNRKKTLVLSIIGILVLVIAVVGVSFAMFTFSGTGTKENVIKTGSVSINFDNTTIGNKIEIANKYPMADDVGMAQADNQTTFTVEASWGNSPMTINYEVGLSDISAGTTLTDQYVKVAIQKNDTYVKGTASGGVTIASFASDSGPLNLIESYYVTNGTLNNSNLTDTFKVRVYVSDQYELPSDTANSTNPEVIGGQVNNNSGSLHKKTSKSETYSFKVCVKAQQA